jgi:hypothetical protein
MAFRADFDEAGEDAEVSAIFHDCSTLSQIVLSVTEQTNVPLALLTVLDDCCHIEFRFAGAPDFHFSKRRRTTQQRNLNRVAMAVDKLFRFVAFAFLFNAGGYCPLGRTCIHAPEDHLPKRCIAR